MGDEDKTKEQLIEELHELRCKVDELKEALLLREQEGKQFSEFIKIEELCQNEISARDKSKSIFKKEKLNLERQKTTKKMTNYEIEIQREWFYVTLSSIGDAVIATDINCNIAFMNSVAEELTGYTLGESLGKHIGEVFKIFNENTMEPAEIPVYRVIKDGFVIGLANHTGLISKTGEKHSIADSAAPIKNKDNEVVGVVMVFRDITETKRLEEEFTRLDKLNLLGQMAAGIAHEIRNPMTTVRGFLQLLLKNKECKSYRDYFDVMIEELDRANSIIQSYLSMAKTTSSKIEKINLNSVIKKISPLIQADAVLSNKYIELELGDIPDLWLDGRDIRQIIMNIARNGLEAMQPKDSLTLKTYAEGDFVVLSVKDQGKGIAPDLIEKIGLPFFTTKENGTGLGLSICYSIAEQYGAAIDVQTGDTGTTFNVRFNLDANLALGQGNKPMK